MRQILLGLVVVGLLAGPAVAQQNTRGELSSTGAVRLDTGGAATASITVSGTYSGTVSFEVIAGPGTAAVTVDCATPAAPGTAVNSTTSTGVWVCPVAGMSAIQARMSSYTSGTATIDLIAAPAAGQSVAAAGGGGTFDGVLLDAAGGDPLTDTVNDALKVNVVAGATSGTQYTQADTDASITGTAIMFESNTGTSALDVVSASAPLPVTATNLDVQIGGSDTVTVTATNLDVQIGGSDTVASNITQFGGATASATNPIPMRLSNGSAFVTPATDATFGTTTYTETSTTGPVLGAVRNDTLEALANTNNEIAPVQVSALGAVYTSEIDPCSYKAKTVYVVNVATATTTEIANAVASEFFYICSINLVAAAAQTIAIVEDDTDGVGSPTAGLNGGTTAATGWSFAANGGIALGNGSATVMKTGTANRYLGFITGQAAQLSGTIVYVSAP